MNILFQADGKLDRQKVIDIVWAGAKAQDFEVSINTKTQICQYASHDGAGNVVRRCDIGQLFVPIGLDGDEIFQLEDNNAEDKTVLLALGFPPEHAEKHSPGMSEISEIGEDATWLRNLQYCHDGAFDTVREEASDENLHTPEQLEALPVDEDGAYIFPIDWDRVARLHAERLRSFIDQHELKVPE